MKLAVKNPLGDQILHRNPGRNSRPKSIKYSIYLFDINVEENKSSSRKKRNTLPAIAQTGSFLLIWFCKSSEKWIPPQESSFNFAQISKREAISDTPKNSTSCKRDEISICCGIEIRRVRKKWRIGRNKSGSRSMKILPFWSYFIPTPPFFRVMKKIQFFSVLADRFGVYFLWIFLACWVWTKPILRQFRWKNDLKWANFAQCFSRIFSKFSQKIFGHRKICHNKLC